MNSGQWYVLIIGKGAIAIFGAVEPIESRVDRPDPRSIELDGQPAHHLNLVVVLVCSEDRVAAAADQP